MPATWHEVSRELGWHEVSAFDARYAIPAAAHYMSRMINTWTSPRPWVDRVQLAQASYNAGAGSLIRAQRLCDGALAYAAIVQCLPRVTGKANAHQTTEYVQRIWRYWMQMRFY